MSRLSLAAVETGVIAHFERPRPPEELTDEQALEWVEIVNRLPADWFNRETHGLLAQYCRHLSVSRKLAKLILDLEGSPEFTVKEYDKLLKMQDRESRAIATLATKMRIAQQSTYDKKKIKDRGTDKPWQQ